MGIGKGKGKQTISFSSAGREDIREKGKSKAPFSSDGADDTCEDSERTRCS
jgi:hypothetical protein